MISDHDLDVDTSLHEVNRNILSNMAQRTAVVGAALFLTSSVGFKCSESYSMGRQRSMILNSASTDQQLGAAKDVTTPLDVKIAGALINTIFSIKPLWKYASSKARASMVERGSRIGVDWAQNVGELERDIDQLSTIFESVKSTKVIYPDYYLKPFHAYDEGNLSWQAAMEVEPAALTVHAPIYTKEKNELDINGDFTLRDKFHKNMKVIFDSKRYQPKRILDVGCSTGLSTLKLHDSFPDAEVIGLDLSPHMLSVAKHNLDKRASQASARSKVTYLHAAGEDTRMAPGDVDLVSMSLVSHELPASVSREIFTEAWRVLPSGGAISIMDMNPRSIFFQKFAANPFAFAAFKSTEPWLSEYVTMDLEETLRECGFTGVEVLENSPRHRTVVAYK